MSSLYIDDYMLMRSLVYIHGKWSCLPCCKCNKDVDEWSKVIIVIAVTHVSNP